MKIWIDILTPKQLLFAEAILQQINKNHQILCTSRHFSEVVKLAKIRDFKLIYVGKYGNNRIKKLEESISRTKKLMPKILKFSPDLTISFCSPEASRISFGIGVKHIALTDSPHSESVMRLTLPLIQKLLTPKIIPKKEFSKFGINKKNIIQYNAIDAFVTYKRKIFGKKKFHLIDKKKKNILIRIDEEQASYIKTKSKFIPILKEIIDEFKDDNIFVLARYKEQVRQLEKKFGKNIKIFEMAYDGKYLLKNIDVFIGSGGTMTAESALLGIPTISYNAVPNLIESFLVKSKIIKREDNPKKICKTMKTMIKTKEENKVRVNKILKNMEDPIKKLVELINKLD